MTDFLLTILNKPYATDFLDSLSVCGKDGSLKNRLLPLTGQIIGKTGTQEGLNALVGYATTNQGRTLAFCIFVNNHTSTHQKCRATIDDVLAYFVNKF